MLPVPVLRGLSQERLVLVLRVPLRVLRVLLRVLLVPSPVR